MERAEKISITLTPEMLQAKRDSVTSGEYGSTSEVVRDAVRLWQRQRTEDAERLSAIRERIRRSLDDHRPDLTLEEVDAHLEALFAHAGRADGHEAA